MAYILYAMAAVILGQLYLTTVVSAGLAIAATLALLGVPGFWLLRIGHGGGSLPLTAGGVQSSSPMLQVQSADEGLKRYPLAGCTRWDNREGE